MALTSAERSARVCGAVLERGGRVASDPSTVSVCPEFVGEYHLAGEVG